MKKKLEADLMSIAHQILKIKDKSDVNKLLSETQKLYEKLAVLSFVNEYVTTTYPEVNKNEINNSIFEAFEKQEKELIETKINVLEAQETPNEKNLISEFTEETSSTENKTVYDKINLSETANIKTNFNEEKIEAFSPTKKTFEKNEPVQISFEELLGVQYNDDLFVKAKNATKNITNENLNQKSNFDIESHTTNQIEPVVASKTTNETSTALNEKLIKGIHIDLNDRIGFIKHLFGNSNEEYNRVLNQLITFNSFAETKAFIDEMIKPDYNYWKGKEEYENRFIELIEKKFL